MPENRNIVDLLKNNFNQSLLDDLLESDQKSLFELKGSKVSDPSEKMKQVANIEGVIDISNYCKNDCDDCEISTKNFALHRYRLDMDEIFEIARKISSLGLTNIIIKSGMDLSLDMDIIAYLVYTIKNTTDVKITLSLGLRSFDEYKAWKIAGADNYFIYDCQSFNNVDDVDSYFFQDTKLHLKYLKTIGYNIYLGKFLKRNELNYSDLFEFMKRVKVIKPEVISFEPVLLGDNKPAARNNNYPKTILNLLFIAKLMYPDTRLSTSYIYDELIENGINCAFTSGCDTLFADFTPEKYIQKNITENSILYSSKRLKNYHILNKYL